MSPLALPPQSPPSSMPKVAIAVVSWNTRDLLVRCLDSLAPEVQVGRAEVWVVDNASTDGSAQVVRERYGWVHLIASDRNLGFGQAVNLVADRTTTEWLATANADVALRRGALEQLLDTGARDRGAGAVAPQLMLSNGEPQHSVLAFPTLTYSCLLSVAAYRFSATIGDRLAFPGHWDMERARRVPWAIAAFLLVRRSAWNQVGGFDERQWMYAEDLDLGWRLHQAGWATRYEPRAVVDHESGASTTQLFGAEVAPHWQRSTYGFISRRQGAAYARGVALFNLFGAVWRWGTVMLRPGVPRAERAAYFRWIFVHLAALDPRADLEQLR